MKQDIEYIDSLKGAIYQLTGLYPVENITDERYCLSLGTKHPLEIGYDKNRKVLTERNMSFSAHLEMVSQLVNMAKNWEAFVDWIYDEFDLL